MTTDLNPQAASARKLTGRKLALALAFATLGIALAAGGIYVGETDDAPGAALLGLLLMVGLLFLAAKTLRLKG